MDLQPELDLNPPAIQAEVMLRRQNNKLCWRQMINTRLNLGRMIWNKPYMMRHLGFTNNNIVVSSHSQQIRNQSFFPLLIYHNIRVWPVQVVPGRAGGGSFKKKELYSKERICL